MVGAWVTVRGGPAAVGLTSASAFSVKSEGAAVAGVGWAVRFVGRTAAGFGACGGAVGGIHKSIYPRGVPKHLPPVYQPIRPPGT